MDWTVAILIYLFTLIPKISDLFVGGVVLSVIAVLAMLIGVAINHDIAGCRYKDAEVKEAAKARIPLLLKYAKRSGVCVGVFVFALTLWPTQKDVVYVLGGAFGVEQTRTLIQSDRAQVLGNKTLDAVEAWLDSQTQAETEVEE